MLLGLNGIDENADDAIDHYAEGLAMAMALQEEAKEELEHYIGLRW